MTTRVLVIGGYGNFGQFISKTLSLTPNITVIVAGRSLTKANALATTLTSKAPHPVEAAAIDINNNLADALAQIKPDIVIHTSGPFQGQDFGVAKACILQRCHYIDLADARDFVYNITELDSEATQADLLVCSGASSVPGLSSAIIDHYKPHFKAIDSIDYAITTAQHSAPGLATTQAILSYAGKPFHTLRNGKPYKVYGWLGLRFRKFWGVKTRALSDCDIPDLALFPERYPELKNIRFQAGVEVKLMHVGLWFLSWLVRLKVLRSIRFLAPTLLKLSGLFDVFGSARSGFYFTLEGVDENGAHKAKTFELLADGGDGSYIPCMASIVLARKLARGEVQTTGAMACVGLTTLDEYLDGLSALSIRWRDAS